MAAYNLPEKSKDDSAAGTKIFFEAYGKLTEEFLAIDVDAAVSFFTAKGFIKEAAEITAMAILRQAKAEGVPTFSILDTLKDFDGVQLSELVAKIMNNNRTSISLLGFRSPATVPGFILRNARP